MKQMAFWSMMLGVGACAALSAVSVRAQGAEAPVPAPDTPWFIKTYDKDGDGKISPAEREAAMADLKQRKEKRELKRFDKNHNGVLDPDEKAAAQQAEQRILKKYDKDGDGKLSPVERQAMEKDWQARRAAKMGGATNAPAASEGSESGADAAGQ